MGLKSNRGGSHERKVEYLIEKLKQNMGFLTEKDLEVLEWMGTKGDYPEKEVILKKKQ